ncbi:MAG: urease accessory protein UreE [Mangrovicoccus sp.]
MDASETLLTCREIGESAPNSDQISLSYDDRLLRRKRLVSASGQSFLVDLPKTQSVEAGRAFLLSDGQRIEILAAAEPLLKIEGDLPKLAWHIGNRHTPCEIQSDALLIRDDHVIAAMLTTLGAKISKIDAPFQPEGGAYGHGRTFGHSHD